jgi:excisionase family DNA binding protein
MGPERDKVMIKRSICEHGCAIRSVSYDPGLAAIGGGMFEQVGFGLNSAGHTRADSSPPGGLLRRVLAAKFLGVCDRTLHTLDKTGELRAVRIGSRVLYDPRDLAEYVERQKAAPPRRWENVPEGGGQ